MFRAAVTCLAATPLPVKTSLGSYPRWAGLTDDLPNLRLCPWRLGRRTVLRETKYRPLLVGPSLELGAFSYLIHRCAGGVGRSEILPLLERQALSARRAPPYLSDIELS